MNKGFVDYYKILRIDPTNDLTLIKKAYKRLAKLTHPDVNGTGDDTEFKRIQGAYDFLNSEEMLNKYYNYYKKREAKIKEEKMQEDYRNFRRKYESYVVNKPTKSKSKKTATKHKKSKSKTKIFFDNFKKNKYVLNTTRVLGVLTTAIIILNIANVKKDETHMDKEDILDYKEIIINDENLTYEMIRKYEVQKGDTLYDLAIEVGTSVDRIKEINNLENDTIYADKTIKLPYEVQKEDLDYCTTTLDVENKSIYDLADSYNTTAETIYNLNREAIITKNGNYYILSDTIKVPNFLSKNELEIIKNQENTKILNK